MKIFAVYRRKSRRCPCCAFPPSSVFHHGHFTDITRSAYRKGHKEDTESELDMLKEGMKRIERIAMMYGPLEDEMGLLDAIETWKLEFLAVSTKRKKRRKKEEKHGLG